MMEQLSLFEPQIAPAPERLQLQDGELAYYPDVFSSRPEGSWFEALEKGIAWQQDAISLYGKRIPLPRLTAWYGDPHRAYTYSGIAMQPSPWTPLLLEIKTVVEELAQGPFNSVLLNYYRTGQDGVSWHADDEPELQPGYPIASVSFGGTRRFMLKHKTQKELPKVTLPLDSGSVLLMLGALQQHWLHQVPKTQKWVEPRINLTFRLIQ
jgi:alkylated DNA repair dioxygenase AlkB